MKNPIKRSLAGLLTVLCLVTMIGFEAHAASGKIAYSDPTVTVGNNVSVTMTVSGDTGLGTLDATLTYDTSLLEFVSGSGPSGSMISGGSGSIIIAWSDTSQPTSITCTLTFKTKNSGTAKINTSYAEVCTLDEEEVGLTSKGSSTITINPVPTASSEARLSSLKVSSATLSPGFSPDTFEYSATVAAGTKKAVISLGTKDSKATYSISDANLKVGSNTITITVKAEDGTTQKYTIKVTRPPDPVVEEPDEPDEPDEPVEPVEVPITITVEGVVYHVAETLEGITLPEGFEKADFTYQDETVSVAKGLAKPLTLFYLTDANGANGTFYIYDQESGDCYPYQDITSGQKIYTLIEVPVGGEAPAGYARSNFTLGSEIISAWTNEEQADFILIYAMNWDGEAGFYRYDTVEQTMQRYVGELVAIPVVPEEPSDTDAATDAEKELLLNNNQQLQQKLAEANDLVHKGKLLILGLMVLVVILLILVICMLVFTIVRRRRDRYDDYDEDYDDDNDPPRSGGAAPAPPAPPAAQKPAVKPAPAPVEKPAPAPAPERPAPAKTETPDDDVDLSRLGLGDIDLSQIDVDGIDFDDFDF